MTHTVYVIDNNQYIRVDLCDACYEAYKGLAEKVPDVHGTAITGANIKKFNKVLSECKECGGNDGQNSNR